MSNTQANHDLPDGKTVRNGDDFEPGIRTITGKHVNLVSYAVKDVDIYDIARGLSCTTRFAGHMDWPLNVAYHSILVRDELQARLALSPDTYDYHAWGLAGLLHDSPEAYCADFPAPTKPRILIDTGVAIYPVREIEKKITRIIFRKFGIEHLFGRSKIKTADRAVCRSEMLEVCNRTDIPEDYTARMSTTPIVCMSEKEVEQLFLKLFWQDWTAVLKGTDEG